MTRRLEYSVYGCLCRLARLANLKKKPMFYYLNPFPEKSVHLKYGSDAKYYKKRKEKGGTEAGLLTDC